MPLKQPDDPEDLDDVTECVNAAAADPDQNFIYTRHALERMGERQLNPLTVAEVLKRGRAISCVLDDPRRRGRIGHYRYCFRMTDAYGWVEVVTAINRRGDLVIVTVIRDT
jgi:hypothetical protein